MSKEERRVPELRFKGFFEDWEQRELGDLADKLEYGLNASATDFDGENKYLRITDIDDDTHKFKMDNLTSPYIDIPSSDHYLLKPGDLLFARTGASVGKTYLYNERDGKVYFAGFLIRAKILSENNPQFIFQNTLTKKYLNFIRVMSQRSGQPGVNANEYAKYKIVVPKNNEQKKIGVLLELIDNIITLHQRKLHILEKIKSLYVYTAFPKQGQYEPKLRFKNYDEEWQRYKLGDLADIISGGTPSTKNPNFWDGDIDWYSPAEIGNQIYVEHSKKRITKLGLQKSNAKLLPVNTVLFTSRAGIGNTAILAKVGATNQGFQSIIPKKALLDSYFLFTRTAELKRYGEVNGAGSTFVEVSGKQMSKMPIIVPKIDEQIEISKMFKNIDNILALHHGKLEQLKKIKKVYLNKMFI